MRIILGSMAALLIAAAANFAAAKPPPGIDLNSPLHHWFHAQHSITGAWCCDISDGHILDDSQWRTHGGVYQVKIGNGWVNVPDKARRDPAGGPNPTGHAIVWYNVTPWGIEIYCFAPGFEG